MDDFAALHETEHMLRWLADEPYAAIRSSIEDMLRQQVGDPHLRGLRVTSAPQWLTGARPSDKDSNKMIIVRSGVAFEFAALVQSAGQVRELVGVFTWVGVQLDQPGHHKHRVWMDVGGKLSDFGADGELKSRVYFE